MNRLDASIGMVVIFGRDGEQSPGKIVKLNPTRVRVELLEQRGKHPSGTLFNVPYHLVTAARDDQAPATRVSGLQSL